MNSASCLRGLRLCAANRGLGQAVLCQSHACEQGALIPHATTRFRDPRAFCSAKPNEAQQGTSGTQGASQQPESEPKQATSQQQASSDGPPADPPGQTSTADSQTRSIADMARDAAKMSVEVANEMWRRLGSQATGKSDGTATGQGSRSATDAAKEWIKYASKAAGVGKEGSESGAGESAGQSSTGEAKTDIVARLRTEVAKAVLADWDLPSVMKRRTDVNAREIQVGEGPADLVVTDVPQSWLDRLKARLGSSGLAKRISQIRETEAARSVAEGYHTVRERLEQGDSEVVNRVSEMRQRMMTESEAARAYREIRMRHPDFDMPMFLRAIKGDVPVIIKAYLTGDSAVLKEYVSEAMLERLSGIHRVTVEAGQISDPTILEYSDVDMVDVKMLEADPVIILHFSCQQINCTRDQYGTVVSGSPDEVNRVYYYWAVQMDGHGMVTEEGQYIPPRWKLIEMLLRGMHQLL